jgi:hypothetical protein
MLQIETIDSVTKSRLQNILFRLNSGMYNQDLHLPHLKCIVILSDPVTAQNVSFINANRLVHHLYAVISLTLIL